MKKTLIAALGLFGFVMQANIGYSSEPAQHPNDALPTLKLAVYDFSNKVPSEVKNLKYSVSKKDLKLCWTVSSMPFIEKNKVIEAFKSPAKPNQ